MKTSGTRTAPMRPAGTSTKQPSAPTGTGKKYGESKRLANPTNDRHGKGLRPAGR